MSLIFNSLQLLLKAFGFLDSCFHTKLCFGIHCYRPQRTWAKVIFSQACVKNSVHRGGGGGLVWGGILQIFGGSPIFRGVLQIFGGSPNFQGGPPNFQGGLQAGEPKFSPIFPPPIRLMSGRYTSYWNAFLFEHIIKRTRFGFKLPVVGGT